MLFASVLDTGNGYEGGKNRPLMYSIRVWSLGWVSQGSQVWLQVLSYPDFLRFAKGWEYLGFYTHSPRTKSAPVKFPGVNTPSKANARIPLWPW